MSEALGYGRDFATRWQLEAVERRLASKVEDVKREIHREFEVERRRRANTRFWLLYWTVVVLGAGALVLVDVWLA